MRYCYKEGVQYLKIVETRVVWASSKIGHVCSLQFKVQTLWILTHRKKKKKRKRRSHSKPWADNLLSSKLLPRVIQSIYNGGLHSSCRLGWNPSSVSTPAITRHQPASNAILALTGPSTAPIPFPHSPSPFRSPHTKAKQSKPYLTLSNAPWGTGPTHSRNRFPARLRSPPDDDAPGSYAVLLRIFSLTL